MTFFSGLLVGELGKEEFLAVDCMEFTHVNAFEGVLGDNHHNGAGSFAVETAVLYYQRVIVRVDELGVGDELEVLAVDGEEFASGDFLTGLL